MHFKWAKSEGAATDVLESKFCDIGLSILQLKEPFVTKLNCEIEKISISFQGRP